LQKKEVKVKKLAIVLFISFFLTTINSNVLGSTPLSQEEENYEYTWQPDDSKFKILCNATYDQGKLNTVEGKVVDYSKNKNGLEYEFLIKMKLRETVFIPSRIRDDKKASDSFTVNGFIELQVTDISPVTFSLYINFKYSPKRKFEDYKHIQRVLFKIPHVKN
jgi:hypothetical protein